MTARPLWFRPLSCHRSLRRRETMLPVAVRTHGGRCETEGSGRIRCRELAPRQCVGRDADPLGDLDPRELWTLVVDAIGRVDHATIYDNIAADVTRIVGGDVVGEIN
ncbi:hypothetical protein [Rhodococcus sp. ABRD24]|uniref:hypothetical protein n=1 Tax=Rhodococcus sp. ABRD24 TaxID=2507582 RepID=UPI001F61F8AD|nr:hypothetical protein [Rhodococcus sp. ABRD24]